MHTPEDLHRFWLERASLSYGNIKKLNYGEELGYEEVEEAYSLLLLK